MKRFFHIAAQAHPWRSARDAFWQGFWAGAGAPAAVFARPPHSDAGRVEHAWAMVGDYLYDSIDSVDAEVAATQEKKAKSHDPQHVA